MFCTAERGTFLFARCPDVHSRGHTFMLFENVYEIAKVIKAAAVANLRYVFVSAGKHLARCLYAAQGNIFKRSLPDRFLEIAAEIVGT